ncbi:DUF2845 domain-containing protein [Halopseudomonas sp.]|uniref:DUF2845 domain-containing protein n=1 Tax=Halopseudomonas sp. TaxID=2901191 RepID=UPI00311E231E
MLNRLLPLMLLTVISATSTAQAASLRCEKGIVETGDMQEDVLALCGEPDQREHTPRQIDPDGYPAEGSVTVDHWSYGPDNGMVRRLRFIDGRLVDIDSSRR